MTEAGLEYPLRKQIQKLRPDLVVLKHNDRGLLGLPDCSVSGRNVWWLEFKLCRIPKTCTDARSYLMNEQLGRVGKDGAQERMMRRLATVTDGRAWYVIFSSLGEVLVYDVLSGRHIWTDRKNVALILIGLFSCNLAF